MAQQRQNEVAQAKAEADKKIEDARGTAESILRVAEAQSKANKILAESLTPEFVQYEALQKWDGKLPTTMVPGQATPFISVK
jgi:regulator of protease activity HflC (stomatin/prohibitin superfamily)